MDKVQLGARVDPRLYKALRVLAAEQDISVSEAVEEAFRLLLKRHKKEVPA